MDLDETLIHNIQSETQERGEILVRPGAEKFLKEMSKFYEIIVFTAGTKDYADWALSFIDKEGIVSYKLYREHAVQKNGIYVKDISRIGRDIKKVIIIDNVVENFQLQPENGIYIKPWENDSADNELSKLIPILKDIVELKVSDIRQALKNLRDSQLRTIFKGGPIKRYITK